MTRHDARGAVWSSKPSNGAPNIDNLSGTLSRDGVASLHPDQAVTGHDRTTLAIRSESAVVDDDDNGGSATDDSSDGFDDDKMESYDDLKVDPDTLIGTRRSMDDGNRRSTSLVAGKDTRSDSEPVASTDGSTSGIPIRLESTDKQGHYLLTADDPEIKEILRKGIEREEVEAGRSKPPRLRVRDLVFTRQFTTFDRRHAAAAESPFFGFFTLFWLCMSLVFVQVAMKNWRDYGSILGRNQVMKLMFSRDIVVLGLTDGVMYAATFEGYFFQKLVRNGYVNWAKSGWIIQNAWQTFYLAAVIGWTYYRVWPWTHTIFIALHGLVFLMKQHSYAFYNGYLSGVHRRRHLLERKMKQLEATQPVKTSPARGSAKTSGAQLHDVAQTVRTSVERRPSMGPRTSTNFQTEKSDVADVAAAISSGRPINADQMSTFSRIIKTEIDELSKELRGKSEDGKNAYPKNLDVSGFTQFAEYICLPTLVYELEYPRQEKRNWWYILEKTTATFGVLCVMQVISQGYIYPPVAKTYRMKEAGMSLEERWQEFPFIVSDMLFPMLIEQLLTWYLIWECILNVLAELTLFADRGFYGDWWNSVTWDQYARDWNRPVHNFLLRHVYHSSISTFHLSRTAATFVTFLLSALVHEMCMALIFSKFRGYLFCSQLLQMPLVALSRSKFMKGRTILGNTIFWIGLFIGPSVLTSLYLVV